MALAPGTRLGVYEIVDPLGAGGMGEVYRARDTQLRREVAMKILPDAFAADADRTARFRREAELLAALNHPNIAAVYGVEASGQVHAIVMELVEGETLADQIARGPLALDDAVAVARQIVDALEAAHDRSIVHRDLKPANIKITPDGKVKVLDFGLAKALEDGGASLSGDRARLTMSPTLSVQGTFAGVILGTAAYMSPEQARGKPVDRRTDIWAFGCVLYEMLAGRKAFEGGETVSDAVAAILRADIDWNAVPANTPAYIRRLLQRCLQKDPQKRLPHIGVARLDLDEAPLDAAAGSQATISPQPARRPLWKRAIPIAAVAVAGGAAAALVAWALKPSAVPIVTRFSVALPEGQLLTNTGRQVVAIAPDGVRFAYVANQRLFLRTMGDPEARTIQGSDTTGGVINPVFSPDGQSIAYYSTIDRTLKRIPVSGGTPVTLAASPVNPYGMSWTGDYIYVGQGAGGIGRVSAAGGKLETIVTTDGGNLAYGPQLLPDGDTLLFTNARVGGTDRWDKAQIVAHSLKTGARTVVLDGGSDGRYLPTGHLLYALAGVMFAVRFDAANRRTSGVATPVIEGVRRAVPTPVAQIAVSNTGTAVYVPGPSRAVGTQDLAIFDRDGRSRPLKFQPSGYEYPRISPDGRRIAYGVDDGKEASVWICDLSGDRSPRRLTLAGRSRFPLWSPGGERVIFQSDHEGTPSIYSQVADGSRPAERLTSADPGRLHVPEAISPDGKYLLFAQNSGGGEIVARIFTFADRSIRPLSDVHGTNLPAASFSPDGRWFAYSSGDAAGQAFRVYVQPFPPTAAKYEIGNGVHPVWSRDGRELIFRPPTLNTAATVAVMTQPGFSAGKTTLWPAPWLEVGPFAERPFDIGPDGHVIGVVDVGESAFGNVQGTSRATEVRVIESWFTELKQRIPVK